MNLAADHWNTKRRVLQVIADMDFGGAQSSLYHCWPALSSSERYETSICVFDRLGFFGEKLNAAGAAIHCLKARWKYDPAIVSRLRALIRQERCDLIHAHLFPELFAVACASAGLDVRLVYTEHSSGNRRRRLGWIGRGLDALAYRPYDRIVAVNSTTRSSLIRWLPQLGERTIVIPNGVPLDVPVIAPTREELLVALGFSRASRRCLILFVGRLVNEKGADVLIASLGGLAGRDYACLIAGEGDQRPTLEHEVARLGLGDRVRFLGFRSDVPQLLRQVDLVVLPSRFEGLPLILLEAMAAGCPVVATAVDGPAEILRDQESALLVPPADPAALAHAIRVLIEDPRRRKNLADSARVEVRRFSIGNTVGQIFALYDEVGVST